MPCKGFEISERYIHNYKRADFDHLKSKLALLPWSILKSFDNINDAFDMFYDLLMAAINDCVPKVRIRKRKFPAWYTKELICLQNEKELARKLFKSSADVADYAKFSKLRSEFKRSQRDVYHEYLESIQESIISNCKRFWSFANGRKKSRIFPDILKHNGSSANSSRDMAELFNNYFQSVFTHDNDNIIRPPCDFFTDNILNNISINESDVFKSLKSIDPLKASGPDGVPGTILINCAEELCIPLSIIYNISLNSGVFPDCLKFANITPVYKAGDRSLASNYRPISILNLFSKIFESLVQKSLVSHTKNVIDDCQHGFLAGRSTTTNLICYVDHLSKEINAGNQVDSLYLDFSKAFDSVSHHLLLHKLTYYGIAGTLHNWFESYLNGRCQRVVINGHFSPWGHVKSGVPQGSILGPSLFVMYINDLVKQTRHSRMSLYADDSKLFHTIKSEGSCRQLQCDLNNVVKWCNVWKLKLNLDKCHVISFTNKSSPTLHEALIWW
jgi:hypothetical protein